MLGYPPEELATLMFSDIWPDDADRERFCRLIDDQNPVVDYPAVLVRRDGTLLPVTIAASSFPDTEITCIAVTKNQQLDDAGDVAFVVSSAEDISERYRSDEQAAEHLQFFNSLINTVPDAVLILDRDGTALFANTAAATLVGLPSPADLIGRNPMEFVHPDYAQAAGRDLANVLSGNGGYLAHYLMRDLQGNEKWIEGLGTRISIKGREADLVTLRDITGRKSVESELARTNQQYRDLYRLVRMMCDNVPDLIWAKDTEGRYLFANKAICEKLLNADDTMNRSAKRTSSLPGANGRPTRRPCLAHFRRTLPELRCDRHGKREPERFDEFGNIRESFSSSMSTRPRSGMRAGG
jgi:PAS domain S-box-containing protein